MASLISIGQLIDRSIEHYRHHFKELLGISLWILVAYVPWIVGRLIDVFGSDSEVPTTIADWISLICIGVGIITTIVAGIWAFVALVLAVQEQSKKGQSRLPDIQQRAWKLFLPYVWVSVLVFLLFAGLAMIAMPGLGVLLAGSTTDTTVFSLIGLPLFFVGTPISAFLILKFAVETAFAPYQLILEDKRGASAITSSMQLVKGRWFATAIRFVVPKLLYFLVVFLASFIIFQALALLTIFVSSLNPLLALATYAAAMLLSSVISALTTPLIVVTDYHLFDSLRQTK